MPRGNDFGYGCLQGYDCRGGCGSIAARALLLNHDGPNSQGGPSIGPGHVADGIPHAAAEGRAIRAPHQRLRRTRHRFCSATRVANGSCGLALQSRWRAADRGCCWQSRPVFWRERALLGPEPAICRQRDGRRAGGRAYRADTAGRPPAARPSGGRTRRSAGRSCRSPGRGGPWTLSAV
jgi:hypothetical protein